MLRRLLPLALVVACGDADQADAVTPSLAARAAVQGDQLVVWNDSAQAWSNVLALPNDSIVCRVGAVAPGSSATVAASTCTGSVVDLVRTVRITTDQGQVLAVMDPAVAWPVPPAVTPAAEPAPPADPPAAPPPAPAATPAPPASTPAATPAAAPAPSSTARGLTAYARTTGGLGPARRLHVVNLDNYTWTRCSVKINGLYTYFMRDMPPGRDEGIMLVRFKDDGGNTFTSNADIREATVKCLQGSTTVKVD